MARVSSGKFQPRLEVDRDVVLFPVVTLATIRRHLPRHVTARKVNDGVAGPSSLDLDGPRHVPERHHARRLDAGREDDDGATTGSGVVGSGVDFEDEISGLKMWYLVPGNGTGCRRSCGCGVVEPR